MTHTTGSGRDYANISIDRLNSGGPYTIQNIRLVCLAINLMRLDMWDDELKFWCREIVRANATKWEWSRAERAA